MPRKYRRKALRGHLLVNFPFSPRKNTREYAKSLCSLSYLTEKSLTHLTHNLCAVLL